MSSEDESVAIFWDYENCEIPGVADSFLVANGIRRIAHKYGNVKVFRTYLEVSDKDSSRSYTIRSDLQSCGVTLIDCPHNGRKDVADKIMMVDIVAHAIDNPPSTLMLITGDRDFVYAVSTMRLRKYKVVLLAPAAAHASLKAQATVVYEWPRSVLQAEVPTPAPASTLRPRSSTPYSRPALAPPLERQTPSMVRIYSTPNTPESGISTLPTSVEQRARSNSMQHHRSISLPIPEIFASAKNFPALPSRPNYAGMAVGSASPQSVLGQRLSPAWSSSKLAATAPVFQPQSILKSSAPTIVVDSSFDETPAPGEEHDRDATDDTVSTPATPAATEISFDGSEEIGSYTYTPEYAQEQNDRLSASSSAPPTPLDDINFAQAQDAKAGAGQEPGLLEHDEPPLVWAQVPADVVIPTTAMVRLKKPPPKFKLLVRVLERERLAGNTRVNFSQLGSLLRQEHPAVYQRAGCTQLKDYVALAEGECVVIVGKNFGEHAWDNGNKWAALHPIYHGRIPEPQPTGQYPPPPPMQPSQTLQAPNY